jgi:hypothetical protein
MTGLSEVAGEDRRFEGRHAGKGRVLGGYNIGTMELRPPMALWGTALLVAVSTAAFPFIDTSGGGPTLFDFVTVFGFQLAGAVTSFQYADTHHALGWWCSLGPNLMFFLIPAAGIWRITRHRAQAWCTIAIVLWCVF